MRKVPVLAGAGGNNTREVIELAKECQKLGADGILSVTPYYNKAYAGRPSYQHYKAYCGVEIRIPIIALQRAGPNRLKHRTRYVGAACRNRKYHRREKKLPGNITQIAENSASCSRKIHCALG